MATVCEDRLEARVALELVGENYMVAGTRVVTGHGVR